MKRYLLSSLTLTLLAAFAHAAPTHNPVSGIDVQYIDHMCLPLDVEILFATLGAVVKRSGA